MLLRRGLGDATAQDMVDMVEAQNHGIYDAEFREPAPTSAMLTSETWVSAAKVPATSSDRDAAVVPLHVPAPTGLGFSGR